MDTGRLKRFSTEARTILMQGVKNRLQALGFDLKTGKAEELPQEMEGGAVFMNDVVSTDFYRKWMSLYQNVQARSIREVAEEAAYTWFNRFMAIRIMEKRGFVSPVLEYESEDIHIPAIVNEATQGRLPEMTEAMRSQLMELLDDPSKVSEQFALLIVAYCHDNPIINNCFGAIADYTELLLPVNILSEGGFVDMVNETTFITDEQYASAELIGWLYQFYISDRKDEAFAKKGKYDPDEIAPATQIFTPNWIVKYMVQNTIGRIYLDNNPYEDELKEKWKYLVEPTEKTPKESIFHFEDLKDLNFADLASGSGHILNEGFDILFDLYINEGYSRTEAVKNIFRYNLVGLDIDARAKQLATFALLMKACGKDKSFLDAKVMPRVYSMLRPINEVLPNYDAVLPNFLMGGNQKMLEELRQSLKLMNDANTLGSIMKFYLSDATRNTVMVRVQEYEEQLVNGDVVTEDNRLLLPYMSIILALTDKYAAICMNPPYMGSGRFDDTLSNYVKNNYHKSKADLFAIFMDVAIDRLADCGKYGMINMHSWMFLSSFEELRKSILDNNHIDSLLHLGPRTFDELGGEVVQNAAFIITKAQHSLDKGIYFRLIEGKNCNDKEKMFLNAQSSRTEGIYFSNISQNNFDRIPGNVIGYWVSNQLLNAFTNSLMSSLVPVKKGLDTGNNDYFLKYWHEVDFNKIGIRKNKADFCGHYKWAPHDKGGSFCRWYGNNEWIINYENNGEELRNSSANLRSERLYFTNAITWNSLSTGKISFRLSNYGAISNTAGSSLYPSDDEIYSYLSFLNSKVAQYCLDIVSPTLNYSAGPVGLIPIILSNTGIDLAIDNVEICKADWDSHETSWDFVTNPLICLYKKTKEDGSNVLSIKDLVKKFEVNWEKNFYQLQTNEEDLNRKFIDIYSLQDELTPDVSLDEITILQKGEIKIEDNELKWNADVVMKQLIDGTLLYR